MMAKTKKNKKDDELIKLSRESKIKSSIDKNGNVLHLGKSGYLKETGALDNKTLTEIQQLRNQLHLRRKKLRPRRKHQYM